MQRKLLLLSVVWLNITLLPAQIPDPVLLGYWQNWQSAQAPYIALDEVDPRYNVVAVAFAVPHTGTDYQMELIPDQVSQPVLISQVQALQSQGRKVIISMGGGNDPVSLDNDTERDAFISSMLNILNTYGFDGIDVDFEGSSLSVTGGSIAAPVDAKVIKLIEAIRLIMGNYYTQHHRRLLLTMAPETAFVQGGQSAYSGIWGAYLPVIHALRDSLDLLQVQLYNSGSMYGIDGGVYTAGTADFIVAMTEAVIQGFNTDGGHFSGLPAGKIAVGLPACPSAGGGYISPATVKAAVQYLRGNGPKPGAYTLANVGGYPALRGMMTWSVNWDAVASCASENEYADNFEAIFGVPSGAETAIARGAAFSVYPNPAADQVHIAIHEPAGLPADVRIFNAFGAVVYAGKLTQPEENISVANFSSGMYFVKVNNSTIKLIKE